MPDAVTHYRDPTKPWEAPAFFFESLNAFGTQKNGIVTRRLLKMRLFWIATLQFDQKQFLMRILPKPRCMSLFVYIQSHPEEYNVGNNWLEVDWVSPHVQMLEIRKTSTITVIHTMNISSKVQDIPGLFWAFLAKEVRARTLVFRHTPQYHPLSPHLSLFPSPSHSRVRIPSWLLLSTWDVTM